MPISAIVINKICNKVAVLSYLSIREPQILRINKEKIGSSQTGTVNYDYIFLQKSYPFALKTYYIYYRILLYSHIGMSISRKTIFILIIIFVSITVALSGNLQTNPRLLQSTFAIKQTFNIGNKGKVFGQEQQFGVPVNNKNINPALEKVLKRAGAWKKIQLDTIYDYANLTTEVNTQRLGDKLFAKLSYDLYTFPYNPSIEKKQSKITLDAKTANFKPISTMKSLDYEKYLADELLKKPEGSKALQEEYAYLDYKYKIGQQEQQLPLCVYASGFKLFSKDKYADFFKSVERQNYTNFHIVYVDDSSEESEIQGILKYLETSDFSIKNKIKIIHTLQHIGSVGNAYFWINKYCKSDEIVVMIDADDYLAGNQVFKTLSAVYKQQNPWFLYTRMQVSRNVTVCVTVGASKRLTIPAANYRFALNIKDVSYLITFRKQLFEKITVDMILEYNLNEQTGIAYPSFYSSASDDYIIFNLVQMAGDAHLKFITDLFYLNSGSSTGYACHYLAQNYEELKARIKIPLKPLQSFADEPAHVQNYKPSEQLFKDLEKSFEKYRKCAKV